ncbi:MAG: hypothetical protein FJZ00_14215, partial [Candidatus Sericytochromatia bacterium]|nr:hypothetical protein [Candidatus Tanganyikabacteria bacterium]
VFVRPEAELRFGIAATGYVRSKKKQSLKLKGTYNLRFGDIKPGTKAIELWFPEPIQKKLGEGDAASAWTIPINTFQYPDGAYTMKTILAPQEGKKKALGSAEVEIDNSFRNQCE